MKQSLKAYLPKLNAPKSFVDFVTLHHSSQKYICTCDPSPNSLLKNLYKKETEALLLIGPEGDFTPEEIIMSEKYNFNPASLGDSRLRTETAGIMACCIVSLLNN
jgi:16S rRNA (uracil1498-N3)-methyltransferase